MSDQARLPLVPPGHSFSAGTPFVLLRAWHMSMVKVKFDKLGGVSCIQWTECGPPKGLRSKGCPSTTTFLQSNVNAAPRNGRVVQTATGGMECRSLMSTSEVMGKTKTNTEVEWRIEMRI